MSGYIIINKLNNKRNNIYHNMHNKAFDDMHEIIYGDIHDDVDDDIQVNIHGSMDTKKMYGLTFDCLNTLHKCSV